MDESREKTDESEPGADHTEMRTVQPGPESDAAAKEFRNWFVYPIIAVVALWLFYWVTLRLCMSADPAGRGQFGDTFGGLNTLFSGFAFVALVFTIRLNLKTVAESRLLRAQTERDAAEAARLQAFSNLVASTTALATNYREIVLALRRKRTGIIH